MSTTPTEDPPSLILARAWLKALNARDHAARSALLHPDFLYSAMARNPPALAIRWDRQTFLERSAPTSRAMARPVVMTVKSEMAAGDRAVIETEGYSEHVDGYVYANVYCFLVWVRDGQISEIHDYCCTHTAMLYGEHMMALAAAAPAAV